MASQRGERPVAVLDVGSSKVAAMIAIVSGDGSPRIIGVGQRACSGVRQGLVADMDQTEQSIRAAMDQAERNAGINAEDVVVSISAGGLDSDIVSVEVDIAGHRIEDADIAHVQSVGRAQLDKGSRAILHAEPALYGVDGNPVTNPRGFHASRLGVDIHVISANMPPIRNLDMCVRQAHLGVQTIVASPVAAGMACLAAEERDLGVALVEMGAGVTNVAVFARGMLVGLSSIPMGGNDITDDIAAALSTKRTNAERMKTLYGSATTSPKDNHDMLEVQPINDDDGLEPTRTTRTQLIQVIRQRLDAIFGEVGTALGDMGFVGAAGRQVVLTGGGADLKSVSDFAAGVLGRTVRIGRPRGLTAIPDAQTGPAFSTLAGLALYAAQAPVNIVSNPLVAPLRGPKAQSAASGRLGRMMQLLRANL
jgi:cell division protein FtsA